MDLCLTIFYVYNDVKSITMKNFQYARSTKSGRGENLSTNMIKKFVTPINQFVRSITYLHSGPRVRGLKKDPRESLKSPSGLHYENLDVNTYHLKIKERLNFSSYDLHLSDPIILQCFTHKSFSQGSKPYNEKLALLGSQFLKYHVSVYSLKQANEMSPVKSQNVQSTINGLNFTNLGTQLSKLLISRNTAAGFIKAKQLDELIFWNRRDSLKSSKFNGEHTVCSSVLNALIGGILTFNGQEKTANFIDSELLNQNNEISLARISTDLLNQK